VIAERYHRQFDAAFANCEAKMVGTQPFFVDFVVRQGLVGASVGRAWTVVKYHRDGN